MSKVGSNKSETVGKIPEACASENAAVEFLESIRWGKHPCCARCKAHDVYQMKDRATGERNSRYLWRCRECGKQYTVRIGTVLEDSRIPLRHWCYAFWMACASKKGISALQVMRQTGLTYKSALFLMHRIRWAMRDDYSKPPKMTGTVEVDETFVGGKPRYRGHPRNVRGRGTAKPPVVALIERGGGVRAAPMEYLTGHNLKSAIREHVHPSARIITDQWKGYQGVGKHFDGGHETVNHSRREYVRGDVYTNTAESFFSLLKRGLIGTFHSVSKKHLHRYVDEFAFRHNTRKLDDGARVERAIKGAEGKRLLYRQPIC